MKLSIHTLSRSVAIGVAVFFSLSLFGMTNKDVIKMVTAGLSEETIILAVNNDDDANYDVSAMALIDLKEGGVSEAIIQAMIDDGDDSESTAASGVTGGVSRVTSKEVDSSKVLPPIISPVVGQAYYTRVNFWHEGGKSIATNYSRGELVPVNTQVTLTKVRKKDFTMSLPDGVEVRIRNVPEYTGVSTSELTGRYLADKETKIDLYGEEMAEEIRNGIMRLGMTKDQVLVTRGYPPVHETPSTESDRWVYWSSRFVKLTILFENGVLAQGRGLY